MYLLSSLREFIYELLLCTIFIHTIQFLSNSSTSAQTVLNANSQHMRGWWIHARQIPSSSWTSCTAMKTKFTRLMRGVIFAALSSILFLCLPESRGNHVEPPVVSPLQRTTCSHRRALPKPSLPTICQNVIFRTLQIGHNDVTKTRIPIHLEPRILRLLLLLKQNEWVLHEPIFIQTLDLIAKSPSIPDKLEFGGGTSNRESRPCGRFCQIILFVIPQVPSLHGMRKSPVTSATHLPKTILRWVPRQSMFPRVAFTPSLHTALPSKWSPHHLGLMPLGRSCEFSSYVLT